MGWKNVKEAFDIKHNVIMEDGRIFIGSGFIHDLVSIDVDTGEIWENETFRNSLRENYPDLLKADPEKVRALILAPDTFKASIPVFTFQDGDIIECRCEEPGYPNVTHDGRMMYENRFSTDIQEVVRWAKNDLEIWSDNLDKHIQELQEKLDSARSTLKTAKSKYFKLCFDHPDT